MISDEIIRLPNEAAPLTGKTMSDIDNVMSNFIDEFRNELRSKLYKLLFSLHFSIAYFILGSVQPFTIF